MDKSLPMIIVTACRPINRNSRSCTWRRILPSRISVLWKWFANKRINSNRIKLNLSRLQSSPDQIFSCHLRIRCRTIDYWTKNLLKLSKMSQNWDWRSQSKRSRTVQSGATPAMMKRKKSLPYPTIGSKKAFTSIKQMTSLRDRIKIDREIESNLLRKSDWSANRLSTILSSRNLW